MMRSIWTNKRIIWLVVALIMVLFCIRIINIDQDIAPWGVSLYQPADEGPYAYLAINEKAYGTINPTLEENGEEIPLLISENFITNTVGNALNIIGFHVLGNNYYALRVPYVIIGLINLALFGLLLRRLRINYGNGNSFALVLELALLLWMTLDFTFFNASRIVEPTSIRLMFVLITALIYISFPKSQTKRFFLMGLTITFSCFLVYITNVFLYLAVAIILLVRARENKIRGFVKELVFFAAGSLLVFLLAEAYYHFIFGTEAITNAINTVLRFSKNSSAELTVNSNLSLPHSLALVFARIVSSNPFVYNLPILFAGILLIVPIIKFAKEKQDSEICFLLLIVFSFIAQTFVSSDTITRKMIVVFPIIVSLIYTYIISSEVFSNASIMPLETIAKNRIIKSLKTCLSIMVWVFSFAVVLLALVYRVHLYYWTSDDFDVTSKLILVIFEVLPLAILSTKGIISCFCNSRTLFSSEKTRNRVILVVITLMCTSNVLYCYKYYWSKPQFSEKEAMIEMADEIDGKYVIGTGSQLGFALYNNMKPVVNTPEEIIKIAELLDDSVYFDYEFNGTDYLSYFNQYFYGTSDGKVYFVPQYIVERDYMTFGYSRNLCLYGFVDAEGYQSYLNDRMDQARTEIKKIYDLGDTTKQFDRIAELKEEMYPLHPGFYGSPDSENAPIIATVYGTIRGDTQQPIYGDVLRSIYGNVDYPIYGNVYGDVLGDINAPVYGNIYGKVYGKMNSQVSGKVYNIVMPDYNLLSKNKDQETLNPVWRKEELSYYYYYYCLEPLADVPICNIIGDLDYPVYGSVENVYGDVNAEIYGDVYGNIYGSVNSTVYGRIYGSVLEE